ncbi:hypothetical protein L2E82_20618 [Cichorium intybus]|uniref:Uncharacterized protein n=1 Tax=Cichorium intybus TaxID=13427 RepID=A0ACB9DTF0_CICIN|nr:hypothetical protein L2E82_20618 [Cichorium intybus]
MICQSWCLGKEFGRGSFPSCYVICDDIRNNINHRWDVSPPKQDDKNSSINKNPNAQPNFQVTLTHITCNTRFLGEI